MEPTDQIASLHVVSISKKRGEGATGEGTGRVKSISHDVFFLFLTTKNPFFSFKTDAMLSLSDDSMYRNINSYQQTEY